MPKAEFDGQGKLFWHLAKVAGWDEKRIGALLMKRWNAAHWNAMDCFEKRARGLELRRVHDEDWHRRLLAL